MINDSSSRMLPRFFIDIILKYRMFMNIKYIDFSLSRLDQDYNGISHLNSAYDDISYLYIRHYGSPRLVDNGFYGLSIRYGGEKYLYIFEYDNDADDSDLIGSISNEIVLSCGFVRIPCEAYTYHTLLSNSRIHLFHKYHYNHKNSRLYYRFNEDGKFYEQNVIPYEQVKGLLMWTIIHT